MRNPFKRKPKVVPGDKNLPPTIYDYRVQDEIPDGDVRTYGFDGTIHQTTGLDIGVDKDGNVTEVWFRCQMLPFKQFVARNLITDDTNLPAIVAIELIDRA